MIRRLVVVSASAWLRPLACALLFCAVVTGGGTDSNAIAQSRDPSVLIERPAWMVGDWWEFTGATGLWRLTVIARESDHYALAQSAYGETVESARGRLTYHFDLDGWLTKTISSDGQVTTSGDKFEWVKFPMKVGSRWSFSAVSSLPRGGTKLDVDCRAEGWETVDLGLRRVSAMRIACDQRPGGGGYGTRTIGWYAPEAKRLVRLSPTYEGGPVLNVIAFGGSGGSAPSSVTATPGSQNVDIRAPSGGSIVIAGQQPRAGEGPTSPQIEIHSPSGGSISIGGQPPRAPQDAPSTPPLPAPTEPPSARAKVPTIALNYPPSDVRVDRDQIVIVGLVTADAGLANVQLTVNGIITPTGEVKRGSPGVPVRVTVNLVPGDNVIEVTATDVGGNVSQLVRTVTRGGPGVAAVRPGNRLAVVIGIGDYDNHRIPRLRYAARDAEAMAHVLTTLAGFKKEHVFLLTDRTSQRPTLRNIKSALGTFLARNARKEDTVLVFFAGHGAPEVDPRGLERDGLAKYLIPSDADPNDLYATALSMDEIQTIFGRIEAERIVVFVDACYSGAAGGRTFASNRLRTRDISLDDLFLERLTRSKGRAIVTASRPSEVSLELPELGHGLFTYYLVEGLKGAADADRDGIVTLQELYTYVEQEVSKKSRSVGGNQHPVLKGEMEGPLPLTSLKAR